ncbi:MAG: HAMP domain-containing histidine kinase [Bacteroidia bacterium]|nr:HAMP domain-containing histidine kinase [Bacteroidia bacterium]
MNKKFIPILIFLLTGAMIGLIIIQVIWIDQGIKVRKARFDQNVHEAMNSVSYKVEQHLAMNKMESYDPIKADEWFNEMLKKANPEVFAYTKGFHGDSAGQLDVSVHIEKDENGYHQEIRQTFVIKDSTKKYQITYDTSRRISNLTHNNIRDFQSSFHHYNSMFQQLAWKMIFDERPLTEKIEKERLQSIINEELMDRGINAKYDFAVLGSGGNPSNLLFSSFNKPVVNPSIILASYKSQLLSDNLLNRSILMIHFPKKTNYILSTMWMMLSASAFFILLIMLCFVASIHIILRQKKLSELKNDFINNMTHELKTPVATISLATEMLQKDKVMEDKSKLSSYSEIIKSENQRLRNQIDKVLQAAKLDKGELELKKDEVDLHEIITDVSDHLQFRVRQENGNLEEKLTATDAVITGDKDHLTNIVYNLLDNAIKYKNGHLDIEITSENRDDKLILRVKDSGIGMSRDQQKRIFDKFYRVPTGNIHNTKGFGLGLSYVKRMVELHKGSIEVESEPNKGSTFTLGFPLKPNT